MNATIILGTLLLIPGGHSIKSTRCCDPQIHLLQGMPMAVPVSKTVATSLEKSPKLSPVPVEVDPFKKPVASEVDQAIPVSAITVERDPQAHDRAMEDALALADGIIDGIPIGLMNRFNVKPQLDLINGPNIQGLGLWGLAEIGPGVLFPHGPYERGRPGSPGGGGSGGGRQAARLFSDAPIESGPTQTPEPSSFLIWGAALTVVIAIRRRRDNCRQTTHPFGLSTCQ